MSDKNLCQPIAAIRPRFDTSKLTPLTHYFDGLVIARCVIRALSVINPPPPPQRTQKPSALRCEVAIDAHRIVQLARLNKEGDQEEGAN
jgi:hypothetical protein